MLHWRTRRAESRDIAKYPVWPGKWGGDRGSVVMDHGEAPRVFCFVLALKDAFLLDLLSLKSYSYRSRGSIKGQ